MKFTVSRFWYLKKDQTSCTYCNHHSSKRWDIAGRLSVYPLHCDQLEVKGYISQSCVHPSTEPALGQTCTGIPCFSKVHFPPICFYKRPTSIPVFTIQKKSKEDFFTKKRQKAKTALFVCQWALQAEHTPSSAQEWPLNILPWELYSASRHTLDCVCEQLCFISIYFVHQLARHVLR